MAFVESTRRVHGYELKVADKEDAMQESIRQMMAAPMMFWFDAWQGLLRGDTDGGVRRAQQQAENRISSPYKSRVSANRRRLSNAH